MADNKWHKNGTLYLLIVLDMVGNIVDSVVFNTPDEAWDYFEEKQDEGLYSAHYRAQVMDAPHYQDLS